MFNGIYKLFSNDLAIDLGTANTLIYVKGKGIVSQRALGRRRAARRARRQEGPRGRAEAKEMLGRTPGNIDAIRPLRDGVIADFEITEAMLRYFIARGAQPPHAGEAAHHHLRALRHHRGREARGERGAESAGAREVYLIEEPMAAAIGAGLPDHRAVAATWSSTSAAARPRSP